MSVSGSRKGSVKIESPIECLDLALESRKKIEDMKCEISYLQNNIIYYKERILQHILPWICENHPDWLENSYVSKEEAMAGNSLGCMQCEMKGDYLEILFFKVDFDRFVRDASYTDTYKISMRELRDILEKQYTPA